jgi:aldose 1-epimerase
VTGSASPGHLPPTGEQFAIAAGPYRAVVVECGGGVRVLSHEGRDLLDGYAVDALPDGGRGQVLAPWPNRLRDGRWELDGRAQVLPVDAAGDASHGLVRWSSWTPEVHTSRRVVLRHRLLARPGYPFVLDLRAQHAVHERDGLTTAVSASNVGRRPAPVALGMHPYLAAPDGGRLDDCWLTVPATAHVLVDERRTPTGTAPVEGTPLDLRQARQLGPLVLDDACTGLVPGQDGRVRVLLRAPDGRTTQLWTEAPARWLQLFTGDTLAPGRRRRGLAVEPMTAPANALASGEGLVLLQPGQTLELHWGVLDAGPP